MKNTTITGIILVLLGLMLLAYPTFTYKKREKVLDLGPIQATAEKEKSVPIPPLVGSIAIVSGLALILSGARKAS